MKRLFFTIVAVAVLLFITLVISERDFMNLAYESSIGFRGERIEFPENPPSPLAATGLAIEDLDWMVNSNDQLKIYKISPSALYVEVENDFVYSHGFVYTATDMKQFNLEGEHLYTSNWLNSTGLTFLDMADYASGENYVIVYACSKTSDGFDCNNEKWLFGVFETNKDGLLSDPFTQVDAQTSTPPPPPPVGELR
jgi:hypothetical protein